MWSKYVYAIHYIFSSLYQTILFVWFFFYNNKQTSKYIVGNKKCYYYIIILVNKFLINCLKIEFSRISLLTFYSLLFTPKPFFYYFYYDLAGSVRLGKKMPFTRFLRSKFYISHILLIFVENRKLSIFLTLFLNHI